MRQKRGEWTEILDMYVWAYKRGEFGELTRKNAKEEGYDARKHRLIFKEEVSQKSGGTSMEEGDGSFIRNPYFEGGRV